MSDAEFLNEKRTRASASKVRSGCNTCKTRRVKCDEQKPSCRRCTIGGRDCSYEKTAKSPPSHSLITIYVPSAQKQPTFFEPSHDIDFYHQNVAADISGYFDSDFWTTLTLQLSHSEPVIRHAVAAISAVHRGMREASESPLALQKTSAAIRSLSVRIKEDPNSHFVPLIACLLFTCLELMRGNVDSAMVHMRSGFSILAASRQPLNPSNPSSLSNDSMSIERYIVPTFSRLNFLCLMMGQSLPPVYSDLPRDTSRFSTLSDARKSIFELMGDCLRFIRASTTKAHTFSVAPEDYIQQIQYQCELQHWLNMFEELLSRLNQSSQDPAIKLLRIHHRAILIWLSVCLTIEECALDAFAADFETIVQLSEFATSRLGTASDRSEPLKFSFEIQTIPPLYYTAIKCRVPSVRRSAIELLRHGPRREGLWSAHISTKLAERVIEVEERDLPSGPNFPMNAYCVGGIVLPDENARIKLIGELPGEFGKIQAGGFMSEFKDVGEPDVSKVTFLNSFTITFKMKPWGVNGPYHAFEEEILL